MYRTVVAVTIFIGLLTGTAVFADHGLKAGNPDLQSAGPLTFGPDGILFVGDSKGGAIFALDTGEAEGPEIEVQFAVAGVGQEVAALLGTTPDDILINDLDSSW